MQLFSVDQQRSQSLEAHAASFASFRVRKAPPYNLLILFLALLPCFPVVTAVCFNQVPESDRDSILISFATRSLNAGQVVSKLHVIELGAQPG